ncbi:MAG TPA: patatin-like phospholipase family protein [Pyrinomonadaceae bacterium]|nr:patatin-like phospholipase family protein [Pyrinomonadaceae bacterium]
MPKNPYWPYAENPGLALELAGSLEFVDKVLGKGQGPSSLGQPVDVFAANLKAARRFQFIDFPFIVVYIAFFLSVPLVRSPQSRGWIVIAVLAGFTGILDFIEDFQILRMLRRVPGSSVKIFGQMKWLFYFATLAAEGGLLFFEAGTSPGRENVGKIIGAALIAIAIGGLISSSKGSFEGIMSASKLSALGLLALAFTPILMCYPYSWLYTAEYAVLLRVPLILALLLVALPFIAFFSGAKTLLRGLFDLTPLSLFVVTLATLAVSGTACATASLIRNNAHARFLDLSGVSLAPLSYAVRLGLFLVLGIFIISFAVWFSARQGHNLGRLILAALGGIALGIVVVVFLFAYGANLVIWALPFLDDPRLVDYLRNTGLFWGYVQNADTAYDPWPNHLFALAAFGATLVLYAIVGIYGWTRLGKKRTVPALCSALMLVLMLGWMLAALTFFFDAWHIPTLLIVAAVGFITAQSHRSDHFYNLLKRIDVAPDAARTITASGESRVILVAANGGGIQAGAWTAQVLYGLDEDLRKDLGDKFQNSLRLISSVSGGSVGNGFFVNWLAHKNVARRPDEAAVMSSLDEVAWGLAWPDFLRAMFPWLFGLLIRIGRGRALERAWVLNSIPDLEKPKNLDDPLSSLNGMVTGGRIPAVIMNTTITETGERLLFATTKVTGQSGGGGALVDATDLHTINGKEFDVRVVTAARLSATFPYVTPASRSDGDGPQPHVVDGGYYDNYGMATLVEWLDEALDGAIDKIKSVLVIQIHGAPVDSNLSEERHSKTRGWFYQAFAPIKTLLNVRNAGQVAHNDIELQFLQQKWAAAGVPIHSVIFEFGNRNAPLSWHLTPTEVAAIRSAWKNDMTDCRETVREFLKGSDSLSCGCHKCKFVPGNN